MRHLPMLILLGIAFSGCIKEKIVLDENLQVNGMDPSFALPIGNISLNLGNIEESQDINNFIYSEDDGIFALAFEKELFDYSYGEILVIPTQDYAGSLEADAATTTAINLLNTGESMDFTVNESIAFDYTNDETIDIVNVKLGNLNFDFTSSFKQEITIDFVFPTITNNGNAISVTRQLNYSGTSPIVISENIPLDDYSINFDNDGISIPIEITITLTKTNETVIAGESLDYHFEIEVDEIASVYGYFGQYTDVAASGTQPINLFPTLGDANIIFGDPRINLTIINTAGIEVDLIFNSIELQSLQGNETVSGNDLTNFPTINQPDLPGEEAITQHTISNNGINPNLNEVINMSTTDIVYEASVSTNPNGVSNNFILDTSRISCNAQVVLPLFLGADNFTFVDTMDLDLADILNVDSLESNSIDVEDIEEMTMRVLVDNGFPLDIGVKLYFANEQNQVLDSLWITDAYQYIFTSGVVNFSVPQTDPAYGKVTAPTQNFTDFSLTSQKLNDLVDAGSTRLIIKAIGNTTNANQNEMVKFYPEYNVDVKISAKIDLNIDLN